MSKLTDYAFGVCLLGITILGILYSYERHSSVKAKAEAAKAVETAQSLSQELTEAHASFRIDLDAIKKAQDGKDKIVTTETKLKEKVDAVAAKVQAGQLSDDAADDVYVDSMWEAYCQRQDDSACSTRASHK